GDTLFKSVSGGAAWSPAGAGLTAKGITALAIDRLDSSRLYAGSAAGGVFRSVNGGASWDAMNDGMTDLRVSSLAVHPASSAIAYAGTAGGGAFRMGAATGCSPGPATLCVNGGRFRVEVAWRAANLGTNGKGQSVPLTGDTGAFWFFSANNLELVVKVVDGRAFNNFFWVFYGALSNVEYTLTVTDTATGAVRSYSNPQGPRASVSDTSAFPGGPASMATGGAGSSEFPLPPALSRREREKSAACAADPTTLCLNGGR